MKTFFNIFYCYEEANNERNSIFSFSTRIIRWYRSLAYGNLKTFWRHLENRLSKFLATQHFTKKNYLMASRRKIMNEFLLKIPGFLHQENSTIQEDKECTTKQLQQWEAQNEEDNAEVRQQNSKTSTKSAWSNFFSLTMASEKNEGTGTIHLKALHNQNFIICRFSTIFLRHPEKTSSCIEKEEKLFFWRQSLLDTRFDTELQLTGSQPLWPQFNGQRFLENKIQY